MNTHDIEVERVSKPSLQGACIGDILLAEKKLNELDLNRIIALQKKENTLFGEAAISLGIVTEEDVRSALASQYSYPCVREDKSKLSRELLAVHDQISSSAESFRSIRSGLMLSGGGHATRTIGVLSAEEGDGKTFVASNLAVSFAQQGARTILVDLNFRRPRVHELFNLNNNCGASSLIIKRALQEQAVKKTSIQSLDIMSSGPKPPNPLELLGWNETLWVIDALRDTYDFVIIDTPASSKSADARLISTMCDGAIVVASKGVTKTKSFSTLKKQLDETNVKILGAVLNEIVDIRKT